MYKSLRPLLFKFDAELSHSFVLRLMQIVGAVPPVRLILRRLFATAPNPVGAFGLLFQNPVGLAAGYDKDGIAWRGLACLGFSHLELGTVTPLPQSGNPRPRLFRLPEDCGLINRMGFPGRGANFLRRQLKRKRPPGLRIGVNLGKNRETPNEEAVLDYLSLVETFAPLADYLVINVSSPNTEGLRRLQTREILEALLGELAYQRKFEQDHLQKRVPILVKLSPDLNNEELDDALDAITSTGMDGVIATNTTTRRNGLGSSHARESGGLSGFPLRSRSTAMIAKIHQRTGGMLPIIGVGGIMSVEDAREKLEAGAKLVQVYTGLIYTGPRLVRDIAQLSMG